MIYIGNKQSDGRENLNSNLKGSAGISLGVNGVYLALTCITYFQGYLRREKPKAIRV